MNPFMCAENTFNMHVMKTITAWNFNDKKITFDCLLFRYGKCTIIAFVD